MKNQITALFPTPAYQADLDTVINNEHLNYIMNVYNNDVIELELRNNSSKNKNILENSIFNDLKKELKEHLKIYKNEIIKTESDYELYITQSWLNYTRKNQGHHLHFHQNCIISGVYYFQTVENDTITFKRPRVFNSFHFGNFKDQSNIFNCSFYSLPVKKGQLVLFPSELEHQVNVITDDNMRISLAFNVFFKGKIGNYEEARYLEL